MSEQIHGQSHVLTYDGLGSTRPALVITVLARVGPVGPHAVSQQACTCYHSAVKCYTKDGSWPHYSMCCALQEALQAVAYYSQKRQEWHASIDAAQKQLQEHTQQQDALKQQAEQVCISFLV